VARFEKSQRSHQRFAAAQLSAAGAAFSGSSPQNFSTR
jgi:hypothetical protein